jgi:ribosome-associated heat shock protein Hsp15
MNASPPDGSARQRIDKWLWFARVVKTRTLAQKLAISGAVRVNRVKTDSASRPVRVGDVLTIALDSGVRILRIAAAGQRRGPAAEARLLYEDLSPPQPQPREPAAPRPEAGGRPTKRRRRALEALWRSSSDEFPGTDD